MQEVGNKFTSTKFRFCLSRRLSFELTTVFQYVRHVHHGKNSSSHRCSQRHWFGMRQSAPKERGRGQLHWLITLSCKGSGWNTSSLTWRSKRKRFLIEKQSFSLLRKYAYETPEYFTEVLHGSTLHLKIILANCCNLIHPLFLPRHFIFTHKQNINVFKM